MTPGGLDLHPKVAGATLTGALSLIILWVIGHWVAVPPEVSASFAVVLSFVGGWLSPASAAQAAAPAQKKAAP